MTRDNRIYWLLLAFIVFYFLKLLSPILGPFLFSALLAYFGDPIADYLEKYMSRTFAVIVVFSSIILLLTLTIIVFIPLVSEQLSHLLDSVPKIVHAVEDKVLPFLQQKLGFNFNHRFSHNTLIQAVQKNFGDFPEIAGHLMKWVAGSSSILVTILSDLFLVPVVTFYLLRDWDTLLAKLRLLLPRDAEPKIMQLVRESESMLSAFLRGQFMVMNALGIIYAIGLTLTGLDFAILIGFVAGWLSFVPYLGLIIGMGVAIVMALFQFGDLWHVIGVILTFVIGQMLEGSVLTPRFVGERIGLHPVAVIFAVLAGAQLGGFAGMLLALPVAAVLNVLIRHAQVVYRHSSLYTGKSLMTDVGKSLENDFKNNHQSDDSA